MIPICIWIADGARIDPIETRGAVHVFRLPVVPDALRIASNAAAQDELGLARDPRLLGVALRRIIVRQGALFSLVEMDDTRLADGFHAYEADSKLRWTDGDAALSSSLFAGFDGACEVVLHLAGTTRYQLRASGSRAAA